MKSAWGKLAPCTFAIALPGCNADNLPLVFYQATTVGITANASPAQGSPEISLGYRDTDVAVVPVMAGGNQVRGESDLPPGVAPAGAPVHPLALAATLPSSNGPNAPKFSDALSVFGQFSVDTGQGTSSATPTIGLGKFFATGLAARYLANGFADWQRQGLKPLPPTPAQ